MDFLRLLEGVRNPFCDQIMSVITYLGSETLFFVIGLAVFWCVSKSAGYYLLTVGYSGLAVNQFLKITFRVARPWVIDPEFSIVESARAEATGFSFPSGHTANIVASAGSVARYFKSAAVRAICLAAIALTAFSRMYLGVHTPADVLTSLAIGALLVFALYPVFKNADAHPGRVFAAMTALFVISAAYTVYASTRETLLPTEETLLIDAAKNGYSMCGAGLALILGFIIDRKYVNFEVKAAWWAQLIKFAVGLGIVLAIKTVLKQPLLSLFGGHMIAHAVRYFIVVMFAVCAWPLTFKKFSKLGAKNHDA